MSNFILHTAESAAPSGVEALQRARNAFGFAPNLIRVLAHAPAAAHGYLDIGERFGATSLSPVEQQTVLIATSVENGCDYCVAAHSALAARAGIDGKVLAALRRGGSLGDPRLAALRDFTRTVVRERGRVQGPDFQAFLDAGFTKSQALEVVLGVAMKTLSNYVNHIAATPLDDVFAPFEWTAHAVAGAA